LKRRGADRQALKTESEMNQALNLRAVEQAQPWRAGVDARALDILFREARTHNGWQDRPVPRDLLEDAVDLAKMGPTAVNASPLRIVFVESEEGKERLRPTLSPGNIDKTIAAPVTAILAHDLVFYEHLPKLFPHMDVKPMFAGNAELAKDTAFQNATLQDAYFILALRAVGLDTGPMGGFDKDKVDKEFFAGTTLRSNLLVNIGYGDDTKLFPRSPRLDFSEIAQFA
jgi:3-hydroxypropanoate dehydrogenase